MHEAQVALYARVSSDQQARGNTIASQVAAVRERIAADTLALDAGQVFIDDGYSGTTLRRPALERLRDAVAAGVIDRVYVHAPDRLARRYAYQVLLIEEFRRAGAEVIFVNRPIGTSAEDDLLLQVQGMIAEYERAQFLERSRRGRRHAARSGLASALGRAPFGYRYVTKDEGGGVARIEVIEEEARLVRLMFAWVGLDRVSLREVCRRLDGAGVPTRTGRPQWNPNTVSVMLHNSAYIGRAVFGRSHFIMAVPGLRPRRGRPQPSPRATHRQAAPHEEWIDIPVPALVDPALFEATQRQLEENRRRRRERRHHPGWLLQGLVVCRRCGYALYGKMTVKMAGGQVVKQHGYYRCPGRDSHRFAGQAVCDNHPVRSDRLELVVWNEIRAVLEDPRRLADEYRRRLGAPRVGPCEIDALATLERQIGSLRRGISRLIDSYAEGLIDRTEFQPRITGMKQRLARLEENRQTLVETAEAEQNLALIIGRLEDFSDKVHQALDGLDWHGTRDIIRMMIRRIEVDGDHVEIVFRVPPIMPTGDEHRPFRLTPPRGGDWQHCPCRILSVRP
jgi:site-specific DNA recombinase